MSDFSDRPSVAEIAPGAFHIHRFLSLDAQAALAAECRALIGEAARFLFGGFRRRDPVDTLVLESGDAFVFGGPARLRYHGVSRILAGTAPPHLGSSGRFNLTFRQYDCATSG
jgi:alkylated DNA repair dioxygenase AlkB